MLPFGDLLNKCWKDKKTGLLSIAVRQSSVFPVRIYFDQGDICRLTYGPLHGRECLELLECFDFISARYVDGLKAPLHVCCAMPTEDIISAISAMGKTVQLRQWLERKVKAQ